MTAHDTESRAVARRAQPGQIATEAPASQWDTFTLLTPRGEVTPPLRMESIGTIAAGYRGQNGLPVVSRDGTIYVTDDQYMPAIGLREALAERGGKSLTIAFGSNDLRAIMQTRLTTYSKTRLEAHGDGEQITRIHPSGTREQVFSATEPQKYAEWASTMKAQTFVFFHLARWMNNGQPEIYLPDGLVNYRLRTTSVNSVASIATQLRYISTRTGGSFAGIPLDLFLTYREMADGKGEKRTVPIWTLVLRPPGELQLDNAGAIRSILKAGMEQAEALSLPTPQIMTENMLALEAPPVDDDGVIDGVVVTDNDARLLARGGPISNFKQFNIEFQLAAGKSSYKTDEGRKAFLLAYTHGQTDSLHTFAETHTSQEGEKLIETVGQFAIAEIEERNKRGEPTPVAAPAPEQAAAYDRLFPNDDEEPTFRRQRIQQPAQPLSRKTVPDAATQAAVAMSGGPVRVPTNEPPAALERPEEGKAYPKSKWVEFYTSHFARLKKLDTMQRPVDIDKLHNGALKQAVFDVIALADETERLLAPLPGEDGKDDGSPPDVPVADFSDAPEDETLVEAF